MNSKTLLYQEVARAINRTLGRKAVTVERIVRTVEEAKRVRKKEGSLSLVQYLNHLTERMFSPPEVEKLKQSPRKKELSNRMLDLLVKEQVITPREAVMLKKMVR
ncbi:hypothetical protein [Paludifilum halophilum]|uniref:Uncharacterized protein n=1 Tax=Paludifilum halophilum TaxID=1642702 RepID=A0A235B2C1_9BACL|nr:hypothetical protein [Paludifilum halophilum]OYD06434.1 hypothetical protein CHM34_16195 [Paludifilum halophilum]